MTMHTPGPWTVGYWRGQLIGDENRVPIAGSHVAVVQDTNPADPSGLLVALCGLPNNPSTMPDAYVLAAGPDMLAALRGVADYARQQLAHLREHYEDHAPEMSKAAAWEAVLAAIAKAEGRPLHPAAGEFSGRWSDGTEV